MVSFLHGELHPAFLHTCRSYNHQKSRNLSQSGYARTKPWIDTCLDVFRKAKDSGLPPHCPIVVLLTSCQVPCHHNAESTFYPRPNRKLCKDMSRKPWTNNISPYNIISSLSGILFYGEQICWFMSIYSLSRVKQDIPFPLPLVTSALEQLRAAHNFTKHDLQQCVLQSMNLYVKGEKCDFCVPRMLFLGT